MTTSCPPEQFDDFLGLAERDFSDVRILIFHGMSGSGKSTALHYLAHRHPSFRERAECFVRVEDNRFTVPDVRDRTVFIDEFLSKPHLKSLRRLLHKGNTIVLATHVRPAYYLPLRLRYRTEVFVTDRSTAKIARYLDFKRLKYSDAAVRAFCARYGANYTDVDIILEQQDAKSFDAALARFNKFSDLKHEPAEGLRHQA